jgi:hypothetical protein
MTVLVTMISHLLRPSTTVASPGMEDQATEQMFPLQKKPAIVQCSQISPRQKLSVVQAT